MEAKTAKEICLEICLASLEAVRPVRLVRDALHLEGGILDAGPCRFSLRGEALDNIFVVGAGKASASMALPVEDCLGERISAGCVVTPYEYGERLQRIRVCEGGHPVPDEAGGAAAAEILRLAEAAGPDDLLLCLFSGGGSALLCLPAEGITLEDKKEVTRQLLACGASIAEVNAVRKHLSAVKGGLLARAAFPARVVTLLISDVVGDRIDTIASGPTAPDRTTFADCLSIADRYSLRKTLPGAVSRRLERGAAGDIEETPKEDAPGGLFRRVTNLVIGNNRMALEASRRQALELGCSASILEPPLEGEARQCGRLLIRRALALKEGIRPGEKACLLAGGETTVTVRGKGSGGRNQELVLAAAMEIEGVEGLAIASFGTDGKDGVTDAAGAAADGETCRAARRKGLSPEAYLGRNDSHSFFSAVGGLIRTGPTRTNVMDVAAAVILGG